MDASGLCAGCLYIVATPIGHLGDMSFRAVEILKSVDSIFAEDTRHAKKLLDHYQIKTAVLSLHEHNESARLDQATQALASGQSIALISDAGTPLISDPGYQLVGQVRSAGFLVSPIPGPCAAIAALSVAGLPTDRFVFEGFLPAKALARQERLEGLTKETRTLIFYESCHRLVASLDSMRLVFGEARRVVVARELTKRFEELVSGTFEEVGSAFSSSAAIKGELVVLVAGAAKSEAVPDELTDPEVRLMQSLQPQLSPKAISAVGQTVFGRKKKAYYEWLLAHKS